MIDAQQARQEYSRPESEVYQSNSNKYENTEKQGMSKSTKILIIILLVLTFPLWIGIVAGLFGTVVGLIGAAFGIAVGGIGTAFGFLVAGVACIFIGIAGFLKARSSNGWNLK